MPSIDPPPLRPARTWASLVGSIRIGQALITVVLVVIGAWRAVGDGVPLPWVLSLSLVFLGWYGGGLLVSDRTGDRTGDRTSDRRLATWWLLGLTLIWLGAVVVSPEFVWLAFPLWLLAGFVMPLRWAVALSVLIFAIVVAAPVVHTGATSYANVIGPLVGGVFALGISRGYLELVRDGRERRQLIASLVATQEEMSALQDELARTQRESGASAERTRVSRDIHDTVAQGLSSIGMLARSALASDDPSQRARALGQIDALAAEGLADARRIVNALMPAELESTALGDALARMLERLADETGIAVTLHADDALPSLGIDAEIALLRTAQSALANVRTHADASRVVVTLADAGDAVRLDIVDDGVGFDAARWDARGGVGARGGGYGLRSMRARLRELGGGLDVESAPGDGTALSAHLPYRGCHDRRAGAARRRSSDRARGCALAVRPS
ncbi:sensor histidine kinase [Microbacterium sp. Se5.02b]|uniref:sensor histidine kinase n=1 Tax=Microbacterium sp. Se5.02b TaxID=2864103 RepID=UPI001C68C799|nr:sensor histidine kinase [Microbacterium sp. Se5.02b]QYM64267.1 sensor histidine kinase [Microbacterium sp. Se5.02b]